ncbi:hypothetical protein VTL71DRAFT_9736 [Oculimacula yallundae]|uniref:Uncharacterized protein n=1 Tax=Oculimacula yallundae TaxID=86028 RepID=A0ABR4BRQ1_9HELO
MPGLSLMLSPEHSAMRNRSSSTPPSRVQTDPRVRDNEPPRQPPLSDILQWVNEDCRRRFEILKNEKVGLEVTCVKQADQIWEADIKIRQLQLKNRSLSAAQKEQRAELAGERKRLRENAEEMASNEKERYAKYRTMEDDFAEVKAEKNDLVNKVEDQDKKIIQYQIANDELKRQRDASIDIRRQLEDDKAELLKTANETDEAHTEEIRIYQEKSGIMFNAAKAWEHKENGYLGTIRDMDVENQKLDGHNCELTRMTEVYLKNSRETLCRQSSERPEKRRRFSGQTEMSVIMSPSVREQMLVQRRTLGLNPFEERPPSAHSMYISPYHQQHQRPPIPRGPAQQSRDGRSSNGVSNAARRGSKRHRRDRRRDGRGRRGYGRD